MEQKGNKGKSKIISFRKSRGPEHFFPRNSTIPSDVTGSYTGTPITNGESLEDLRPEQDPDDL